MEIKRNKSLHEDIISFIGWLSMPHDVDISTHARAAYWAEQFKYAHNKAFDLYARTNKEKFK